MRRVVYLDKLTCMSVFESVVQTNVLDDVIDVTKIDDVLYLPEFGLQIINNKFVPIEGIVDAWNLSYVQMKSACRFDYLYGNGFSPSFIDEEVCILSNLWLLK